MLEFEDTLLVDLSFVDGYKCLMYAIFGSDDDDDADMIVRHVVSIGGFFVSADHVCNFKEDVGEDSEDLVWAESLKIKDKVFRQLIELNKQVCIDVEAPDTLH